MKKKLIIFIIVLVFIGLFLKSSKAFDENLSLYIKESIRVRVIANSNSQEDILKKEQIKDYVIYLIEKNDLNYYNICDNLKILENELIKKYPENSFELEFLNEKSDVSLEDQTLKAPKEQTTLKIKIDEAKGENYFATLYPNYYNCYDTNKVDLRLFIIDKIKELFGE